MADTEDSEQPEQGKAALPVVHGAPKGAHVIVSLEEWESWKKQQNTKAVLLQCGSPTCTRCPDFTARIEGLKSQWNFFHVYVNTHEAEEDLIEELQVTQLPAFELHAKGERAKEQAAAPDLVEVAITTLCLPVFTVDEDF